MKYMHFNFACSFAGLANMLTKYDVETEDYEIILAMNLPYMLDKVEDTYLAGPMLQQKKWFNIYLNSVGFEIVENRLHKQDVIAYIKKQNPCMLGVRVYPNAESRHAIIYLGEEHGKLKFLNNKRKNSDEPEYFLWTEEEVLDRIDREITTVSYLHRCEKRDIEVAELLEHSIVILNELKQKIHDICQTELDRDEVKALQDKVFRAVLLDNISVLELTDNKELAGRFKQVQGQYLCAIHSEEDTICIGDYIDLEVLEDAIAEWENLIIEKINN